MVHKKEHPSKESNDLVDLGKDLILHNDDIHSFDFVIETLIDVCNHEQLQAEQCAMIAHFKGKCAVKSGYFSELKPCLDEMQRRGLTVTIDTL